MEVLHCEVITAYFICIDFNNLHVVKVNRKTQNMEVVEEGLKHRKHFPLEDISNYVRLKEYPESVKEKNEQSNFRRACKKIYMDNGQLVKNNKVVVFDAAQRRQMIKDVHEGLGESSHANGRVFT